MGSANGKAKATAPDSGSSRRERQPLPSSSEEHEDLLLHLDDPLAPREILVGFRIAQSLLAQRRLGLLGRGLFRRGAHSYQRRPRGLLHSRDEEMEIRSQSALLLGVVAGRRGARHAAAHRRSAAAGRSPSSPSSASRWRPGPSRTSSRPGAHASCGARFEVGHLRGRPISSP